MEGQSWGTSKDRDEQNRSGLDAGLVTQIPSGLFESDQRPPPVDRLFKALINVTAAFSPILQRGLAKVARLRATQGEPPEWARPAAEAARRARLSGQLKGSHLITVVGAADNEPEARIWKEFDERGWVEALQTLTGDWQIWRAWIAACREAIPGTEKWMDQADQPQPQRWTSRLKVELNNLERSCHWVGVGPDGMGLWRHDLPTEFGKHLNQIGQSIDELRVMEDKDVGNPTDELAQALTDFRDNHPRKDATHEGRVRYAVMESRAAIQDVLLQDGAPSVASLESAMSVLENAEREARSLSATVTGRHEAPGVFESNLRRSLKKGWHLAYDLSRLGHSRDRLLALFEVHTALDGHLTTINTLAAPAAVAPPSHPVRSGRLKLTLDERESLVRNYIRKKRGEEVPLERITRDGIAKAVGVSSGAVSGTKAWEAFCLERARLAMKERPNPSDGADDIDSAIESGEWDKVLEDQQRTERRPRREK